jgi:hypothetical protein
MLRPNKLEFITLFDSSSGESFKQILLFLDKPLETDNWQITVMNTIAFFTVQSVTNKTCFLHHCSGQISWCL